MIYIYKCNQGHVKEVQRPINKRLIPLLCNKCEFPSLMVRFIGKEMPQILIKGSYKKKAKPNDPLSGIPIGAVPGDRDFEYLKKDPNNPQNWLRPLP